MFIWSIQKPEQLLFAKIALLVVFPNFRQGAFAAETEWFGERCRTSGFTWVGDLIDASAGAVDAGRFVTFAGITPVRYVHISIGAHINLDSSKEGIS